MNTKPYNQKQQFLFPPRLQDFVPQEHDSHVINDIVEKLNFENFYDRVPDVGNPSYHPKLMIKIIFYGLSNGLTSSREIAKRCCTDTAYMFLAAMQSPNFRTISKFRLKYCDEIGDLFVQIVQLCHELGLISLKHISIDGTKIKANASASQLYDVERAKKEQKKLKEVISKKLEEMEAQDEAEDEVYGQNNSGYQLPEDIVNAEQRLKKLDELIEKLKGEREGKKRNIVDQEAEIQKTDFGKTSGYNGQVSVDSKHNVILAADVTDSPSDVHQLQPIVGQTINNLQGKVPEKVSCDAGYFSYDNLEYITGVTDGYLPDRIYQHQIKLGNLNGQSEFDKLSFQYNASEDVFICPAGAKAYPPEYVKYSGHNYPLVYTIKGRFRCFSCNYQQQGCTTFTSSNRTITITGQEHLVATMRSKLQSDLGKETYKMRKAIVETAFGALKQNFNFRVFSLRGFKKVQLEFKMWCIGYNLKKMILHGA
jgi:transposase